MFLGCGDDTGIPDAGVPDSGTPDAGPSPQCVADGGALPCACLPNPVYLQIGDTQQPLIKTLGMALRNSTVNPMTLVYVTSGSCINIAAMYAGTPITTNPFYIPSAVENPAWTDTAASPTCTIQAGGHTVDLANSALFVSTCDPSTPPSGIGLFDGAIQAYNLVVPKASTQTAITAEEAYFTFGFGAAGRVTPWNDEAFLEIRNKSTTSTLLTWAHVIGVLPPTKMKGVVQASSTAVVNAVANSVSPERTIGLLGAEIYDGNRATLSALAYRARGQALAYYPDSTPTAFDRQNLRDGHYVSWSPTVWLTHVDGQGVPSDARVKYVIDALQARPGITPTPDFKPLDFIIAKGLVPDCAMKVTRSFEGGDLSPYQPASDCGCYYEGKVGGSSPRCADGGTALAVDAGSCFPSPTTHAELINQCTTAVGVAKSPVLPLWDGGALPALP
jgi:hypothetical protein